MLDIQTDTCVKDPRGTPGTQPNWAKAADPKLVASLDALQTRICDEYNQPNTKFKNSGDPTDTNLYSGEQVCILDERCAWMRFSRTGSVDEEEKCGPAPTRAPMTIGKQANQLPEPAGTDVIMRLRDDQQIEERQLMQGLTAPLLALAENGQPLVPSLPDYLVSQALVPPQDDAVMYVEMNNWNSYWRRSVHRGVEPDSIKDQRDFSKGTDLGIVAHDAGLGLFPPNDGRLKQQETFLAHLRAAPPSAPPPLQTLQGLGNVFARSQQSVRSYGGYSCNDRKRLRDGVKRAHDAFMKAGRKWKQRRKQAKKGDDSWKQLRSVADSLREEWEHLRKLSEGCAASTTVIGISQHGGKPTNTKNHNAAP